MGPITTGLGEIYMYLVKAEPGAKDEKGEPYTPMSLRTLQDWVIKPQLRTVPGVVEVNTIGGYEKQYHVAPRPEKLIAYNLSFRDIMTALASNNANVGAGYIERNGEQYLIRAPGQVRTLEDIGLHQRREFRWRAGPPQRRGRDQHRHRTAHRRGHR